MAISSSLIKVLYAKSGNMCAFPKCNCTLTSDKNQSEMAHIISAKPTGPRHDPNFNNGNYDVEQNIILLCPTHHTMIDKDETTYSVDVLKTMKTEHENRIHNSIQPSERIDNFIIEFLKICHNNQIHLLLSEFHLSCVFDGILFEYSDNCCLELTKLLNRSETVYLPHNLLIEISEFIIKLGSYSQILSLNKIPNYYGKAVSFTEIPYSERIKADRLQSDLIKIYNKYRYGSR